MTESAAARPRFTLWIAFVSAVICVIGTILLIDFKTDRSDLIDPSAEFHQRWTSYTEAFGARSDLVVVVQGTDPERIKHALEDLGRRTLDEDRLFSHVLFKVEPGEIRRKGLQYLSPDQLEAGLARLQTYQPVLNGRWERVQLDNLVTGLLFQLKDRLKERADHEPTPESARQFEQTLAHIAKLSTSIERFVIRGEFQNPWPEIVSIAPDKMNEGRETIYLMNETGTIGFLKARPIQNSKSFDGATPAIDRMRDIITETKARHSGLRIGLTGIPVLENDEMRKSQSDMIVASIISSIGVGLLLLFGFRGWRHPILALIMLAVSMCWAFGYTTLVIGHLNILSVSFAAILIGLGIDFGIHYLARYLELRHKNMDLMAALLASSTGVGVGIVTAALTTALAFLCASLTDFLGVVELGIIAGGGVLLCAAATFLVLPALVALADQNTEPQKLPTPFEGTPLRETVSRNPNATALASFGIVIALGFQAFEYDSNGDGKIRPRVGYDYNLLNLQADGLESVEIQKTVFHDTDRQQRSGQGSLLFAVSIADSPQHARELKNKYSRLPSVHHVEELGSRLPEYPAAQTKLLVQGYHALLTNLPKQIPQQPSVVPKRVGQTFEELYSLLTPINHPLAIQAATAIDELLDGLDEVATPDQIKRLTQFQGRLMGSILAQFRLLSESSAPEPVTLDDLPPELTSRFVSRSGKWLVQIYPKNPIWDLEPLREFVTDVRSIDPNVTGTPLQNFEASGQIMQSYQNAAIYALAAVSFVLIIDLLGRVNASRVIIPSLSITAGFLAFQWYRNGTVDYEVGLAALMSLVISLGLILDWSSVLMTALTLLPPLMGGVLMFGLLAMCHIDFNPANLIVLPLILGIGVDDGVHVVHDFRSQRRTGRYVMSPSTLNAIVLTSLTSMIGFGSMMVAAHRGLYSLGLVLVIGVGSCMFVSLVPLPAILASVAPTRFEHYEP